MVSSCVNVGKMMRSYAYVGKGRRKQVFRVSKRAVDEYVSHLEAVLDAQVHSMCLRAGMDKRSTIVESDVLSVLSLTVSYVPVSVRDKTNGG